MINNNHEDNIFIVDQSTNIILDNNKKIYLQIITQNDENNDDSNDKKSYNVIIGPEGDFSDSELNTLDKIKPITINLGPRRLRSETSAIVGLANLNQILNY